LLFPRRSLSDPNAPGLLTVGAAKAREVSLFKALARMADGLLETVEGDNQAVAIATIETKRKMAGLY
jgi:hypothetical protein